MEELNQLAIPLLKFWTQIDLDKESLVNHEELDIIDYYSDEFDSQKLNRIQLSNLTDLVKTYGDAFTGSFTFTSDILEIDSFLDEQKFNKFKETVSKTSIIGFRFELNKNHLVEKIKQQLSTPSEINFRSKIFLYLFVESLKNKLCRSSFEDLESTFWGTEEDCKVILLIPEHEIYLNGAYLSILGGNKLHKLNDALTNEIPNQEKIKSMYERCQELVRWKRIDIKYLTPLHFKVQREATQNDPIARVIFLYQAKMIVLYTADQTVVSHEGQYIATYSGEKQRKKIIILDEIPNITNEEIYTGSSKLLDRVEGIYSSLTKEDEISLFQLVVMRALQITEASECYRLLLLKADHIVSEIRWLWKTFAEGKIDGYISQVKALEDYVANVIQSFSNQVSSMVKSLSDTMLAAVGVALGSFIAALFKDGFNPTIFRIGIIAYGFYVLMFPLMFNMFYQQRYFNILRKNVEGRLNRFKLILDPSKVKKIVSDDYLKELEDRFYGWFKLIGVTYVVVFILALVAAIFVPKIVLQTSSGQQSVPSASPSPGFVTPQVSPSPINPVSPTPTPQPTTPRNQQKGTSTTSP